MKILMILANRLPKINYGSSMRTWSFISALSEKNEISLLCLDDKVSEDTSGEIEKRFSNVWCVKVPENTEGNIVYRRFKMLKNIIKGIPVEVVNNFNAQTEKFLQNILRKNKFDLIFTRYIHTSRYLLRNNNHVKAIIDLDDLEFVLSSRLTKIEKFSNGYYKLRKLFNTWTLRQYYKRLKKINKILVCSLNDKGYLNKKLGLKNVDIVPNSIEVNSYNAVAPFTSTNIDNKIILLCGNLFYWPNIDGVKWFVENIYPKISKKERNVKMLIIGRNPTDEIYRYNSESISILSNVPSMIPYYQKSSIVIVPLRVGGGTRIKILEALACKRPIVTTSIGAEGLDIINNKHCIIENNEDGFAEKCLELLNNYKLASKLTENGYKLVKERYDTKIIQNSINKIFTNV